MTEIQRAKPVESSELKQATPEELKKIGEQAETDSGKKRDLNDPAYVTALNRGWAEHYGDSHPLSKKILDLKGDGDTQKAMDAVKSIQKQLGLEEDGVIGYKTIKAYNEMLEKSTNSNEDLDLGKNNSFGIESDLQSIDRLGADERKEKLKAHSEELARKAGGGEEGLTDINGKALRVAEENGKKIFTGSDEGENNGKYYNPESGEYESKEQRTEQAKKKEENDKKEQEQEGSKIEGVLNRGEDVSTLGTDYEYTLKGSQLTRSDDTNGVNETWNDIRKTWETKEGKEESDIDDLTQTTKGLLDKYGEVKDVELKGGSKAIKDLKLGELGRGYEKNNGPITDETAENIKALDAKIKPLIEKNPKMAEMTLEQFQNLQENPKGFAASDLVPRDGKAVSPEEFGLKPDGYKYSYANANRNTMVARPTGEIEKGEELDQIKVKMGGEEEFRTQREFLVTRARQIPAGQKFDLPGSPELSYQKTDTGDMQVYKKGNTIGDNGPLYTYIAKDKNWPEKTQGSIGQLAGSGLNFNGNGNTETPETKTASGGIMDGGISMAQN